MKVKELRKVLRSMKEYTDEIIVGNRAIIKTTTGYGVRGVHDHSDMMTDYCAYVFGFKEKWIIEEALNRGFIEE